jgi:hypothetical protein
MVDVVLVLWRARAKRRPSRSGAPVVETRLCLQENLDVLVSRSSVGFEKFLWYSVPPQTKRVKTTIGHRAERNGQSYARRCRMVAHATLVLK